MQVSVPIGIKKNYQLELSFAKKGIFVTVLVRSISFYCFENDYIQQQNLRIKIFNVWKRPFFLMDPLFKTYKKKKGIISRKYVDNIELMCTQECGLSIRSKVRFEKLWWEFFNKIENISLSNFILVPVCLKCILRNRWNILDPVFCYFGLSELLIN